MEVFRALLEGSGIKNTDVKDLGNTMHRLRIALSLKKMLITPKGFRN